MPSELLQGDFQPLLKRSLDVDVCRKFDYRVGQDRSGKAVQIATYRDSDGNPVAQKVRYPGKDFVILGEAKQMTLWGKHLWPSKGRRVVITEGEIDCLSVAQATGLSWPVVSLPNGAQSAKRAIQKDLEWLCGYEQVVLAFDMDEAGRAAAAECAHLLPPGKCAVWEIPRKDASDMLVAGEIKQLNDALWKARTYRPDGIVSLSEIRERVMEDPEEGFPWCFPSLTKATYGRRPGDVIGLGGGTGCGKTDFLTQQMAFDVMTLGLTVGVIYMEQGVGETGRRIAGKLAKRRFHVPNDGWTREELNVTWEALEATNRLFLYDNFGAMDWETIRSKIRYLVTVLGCHVIVLDHLTALAAMEEDERRGLDRILAEAAGDAKALGHILIFVSHLATPEGKPHEEGGRVTIRSFKGSRNIGSWCHSMFGLERDTQSPGTPTTLRCLKDRFTGDSNGTLIGLAYDSSTGLLSECEAATTFTDESDDGPPF